MQSSKKFNWSVEKQIHRDIKYLKSLLFDMKVYQIKLWLGCLLSHSFFNSLILMINTIACGQDFVSH